MTWRYYETPHHDTVTCHFDGDAVRVEFLGSVAEKSEHASRETACLDGPVGVASVNGKGRTKGQSQKKLERLGNLCGRFFDVDMALHDCLGDGIGSRMRICRIMGIRGMGRDGSFACSDLAGPSVFFSLPASKATATVSELVAMGCAHRVRFNCPCDL